MKNYFLSQIIQVLPLALLCSCNHLFFHPDSTRYYSPEDLSIDYEEFWIDSEDGTQLNAWIMRATQPKIGTILHFHGNAQNMSSHFLFVGWMTQLGFDVITMDYRGYGKSGGTPNQIGIVADAVAAIAYTAELEGDIFVVGQSLGAAISVPAISQLGPNNLKAIILDSGFASYREMAREKLGGIFLTWPLQYPLSYLVSDDSSPLETASLIKLPTLVIHGNSDRVVPLSQGRRLFELIGAQNKKFLLLKDGQHTEALSNSKTNLRKEVIQFLCSNATRPLLCSQRAKTQLK